METPRTATVRLTHAARDVDDDEPITLFYWFFEEWGITGQLFDDGSGGHVTIPWSSIALAYFSE